MKSIQREEVGGGGDTGWGGGGGGLPKVGDARTRFILVIRLL